MNYEVCCVPTALSVTRQDCRTTSYFVSCRIVVGGGRKGGGRSTSSDGAPRRTGGTVGWVLYDAPAAVTGNIMQQVQFQRARKLIT